MLHELKTHPNSFSRLVDGTKTFEVRKDDRGYQMGDELRLREYDLTRCPVTHADYYTGREIWFRVGFIFKTGYGVDLGEYVVLSLLPHPSAVLAMNPHTEDGGPIEKPEEVS